MTEFENVLKHDTDLELDYLHHDESMSMQSAFQKEKVWQEKYVNTEIPF